jgi:tocopherol O-methyltransferase
VEAARRLDAATPTPLFLLRDWLRNDLPDAAFDAVIALESLTHMADPAAAIAEAFRVLRPGGRFVGCLWMAAERPPAWAVRLLLRPICDEGRLHALPQPSDLGRWLGAAGFVDVGLEDLAARVAPTWSVSSGRVLRALLRPSSWRYLADSRSSERRFAVTVARMLLGYRTGAMRYGMVSGTRPAP